MSLSLSGNDKILFNQSTAIDNEKIIMSYFFANQGLKEMRLFPLWVIKLGGFYTHIFPGFPEQDLGVNTIFSALHSF